MVYDKYKDKEARKLYNREYQREYMRSRRAAGKIKIITPKDFSDDIRIKNKECRLHGITIHVLDREKRYRCRKCRYDALHKTRKNIKKKCVEYLGGKCISCGYDKCIAALEFHHRDSSHKDFAISGGTVSWERTKKELDKCDLLCANCHRELHHPSVV